MNLKKNVIKFKKKRFKVVVEKKKCRCMIFKL